VEEVTEDKLPRKRVFLHTRNPRYAPAINDIDRALNRAAPDRMTNGTEVTLRIERICGFEIFGCYENWCSGYRISDGEIAVTGKWLDTTLARFLDAKENGPKEWEKAEKHAWAKLSET